MNVKHTVWLSVVAGIAAWSVSTGARSPSSTERGAPQASSAAPQTPEPASQAPIFRTSVDVVPVDVSVVDKDGQPVEGLTPEDFTLKIDGRPRQVRTVEYITQGPSTAEVAAAPLPTHYSANDREAVGRLVMIAVDESSFSLGDGRPVLQTATKFLDRLTPNDHVGLMVFPGVGPNIDFTTNHAVIRQALTRISGKAEQIESSINIGVSEAVAIDRGDREALREVITRECQSEDPLCAELAEREARMVANFVVVRARTSLTAIRAMLNGLRQVEGTKNLVFISGGLVSDSLQADITELGFLAQAAQVNIYVLQLDLPRFDAALARPSPTYSQDEQLRVTGLETLAGSGRGALFRVVGSSQYAFDRIAKELSGYYMLTFEPEGDDRNGKRHNINVAVNRKGVTLRARHEFSAAPDTAARTDRDRVLGLLRAPLAATKLPIKITTYTYQEARGSRLRTYICAELDMRADEGTPATLGYFVSNDKGQVVANAFERVGSTQFVASALLEPGSYRLKLAAVDPEGRAGSLEHRFKADVAASGSYRLGSLMLAEAPDRPGAPPRPSVNQPATDIAMAYLEVYSDKREALQNTTVQFDVLEADGGEALLSSAPDRSAPTGRRRPAQGLLPVRLLPPGDYVLRAALTAGSETITTVTRPFRMERTPTGAPVSTASESAIPAALRLRPEPKAFDKAQPLDAVVLGYFLDQLPALAMTASSTALPEVMEHAKAARFDEAARAASGNAPGDRVLAAFMRGLSRYEKSDWQGAAREFRASVGGYSEFFPALFYIGACLAANGRDGDAAAAWQTALSIDNEVQPAFPFLADALFRLNDGEQAAGILEEAREIWPDDERLTGRLATAYAMIGRQDDAFTMLEQYLDKRSDDVEALFLALRLLFEARLSGRVYHGPEADASLFKRYADSYVSARGPNQPIVKRWVRHFAQDVTSPEP
ncbi:MAG: VWA domain-containing protein [Vicinamibacterales bacterium]